MYNTTTAFRELMAQPSRQLTARGTITFSDATTYNITAAEITYIQVTEDAGAHLPLGGVSASSLALHLDNRQGQWNRGGSILGNRTLDGAAVKLEVGVLGAAYEYSNLGFYILEDAIGQEQEPVIVLKGADYLANKACKVFNDTQTYPRTLGQILVFACAQAGITLKTTTFVSSAVSIPTKPKWEEGTTCRGVIGYVACCAAGFARMDRNGQLEIVKFEHTPDYQVGPNRYIKLEKQGAMFGPFNALSVYPYGAPHGYGATRIAADMSLVDNELNSIAVQGNPLLAYGSSVFDTLITNIRTALNGLTFHGGSIIWQGDPTLTTGDIANVTDLKNEAISLLVLHQTITLDSGFAMQSGNKLNTAIIGQAKQEFVRVFTPTGKLNGTAIEGDINIRAGEQLNLLAGGKIVMEAPDGIVMSSGKGLDTALGEKAAHGDVTNLAARVSTAEQKITPDAITATVRNHANYKSDLAGKNRTYLMGTPPSGAITGDLWVDTANGNLLKRWDGSSWAAVQDGAISIAQNMANKIAWLIASGDSASNMVLTEQLYELVTNRVMITANEKINLAVGSIRIGGTNLIPNSGNFIDTTGWWIWSSGEGESLLTPLSGAYKRNVLQIVNIDETVYLRSKILTHQFKTGDTYTVSFLAGGNSPIRVRVSDDNGGNTVIDFGFITPTIEDVGGYYRYESTAQVIGAQNLPRLLLTVGNETPSRTFDRFKLEVGNKATQWSPAPEDPSRGLKTAGIEISPGTMNLYAGLSYSELFGSGATEMGRANTRADGLGFWMGGSPANAKNKQWMNGVAQFQEIRLGNTAVNQIGRLYTYYYEKIASASGGTCMLKFYVPPEASGVQSIRAIVNNSAPTYYVPGQGMAVDGNAYPASGRFRLLVDGNFAGPNQNLRYDFDTATQFTMLGTEPIAQTGIDITALLDTSGGLITRGLHALEILLTTGSATFNITLIITGVGAQPASAPY